MAAPLAVVTGANTGIGKCVAGQLAVRGYDVVLACRSPARAEAAAAELAAGAPAARGRLRVVELDLASLRSVAAAAEGLLQDARPIAVLVCNAGLNAQSAPQAPAEQLTEDGCDVLFQANYLGHFALVLRLLPLLRGGRVVNVSSVMHRHAPAGCDFMQCRAVRTPYTSLYSESKLAQLLFADALWRREGAGAAGVDDGAGGGGGVTVHSVNPGGVASDIWRGHARWLRAVYAAAFASPARAAETVVAVAVAPELRDAPPRYFNGYRCASWATAFEYVGPVAAGAVLVESEPTAQARDAAAADRLWALSLDWARLPGG